MGTTANLELPYPEGTDLVIAGDDAIEALAARLDYLLSADASVIVGEGNSPKAISGATGVDFPGTRIMAGFTVDGAGELFTYTGPARFFMVSSSVEVESGASTNTFSSTVTLLQNGSVIDSSHDQITSSAVDLVQRKVVHKVATPVQLGPGETISVTASSNPAGDLGVTSLRIFPIGPKL